MKTATFRDLDTGEVIPAHSDDDVCVVWVDEHDKPIIPRNVERVTDWVKRIGQWHVSRSGEATTVCGMAILGNNYATVIPIEERKKCPKCHGLGEERI